MRSFFVVILSLAFMSTTLFVVTSLVTPTDINPHAHYESDRDGCMRRADIRKDIPELYTALKAKYGMAYMACMADFGYKGEDLVP